MTFSFPFPFFSCCGPLLMKRLPYIIPLFLSLPLTGCFDTASKTKDVETEAYERVAFARLPVYHDCDTATPEVNAISCLDVQRQVFFGLSLTSDNAILASGRQTLDFERTDEIQFRNVQMYGLSNVSKIQRSVRERRLSVSPVTFDPILVSTIDLKFMDGTVIGEAESVLSGSAIDLQSLQGDTSNLEFDNEGRLKSNVDVAVIGVRLESLCTDGYKQVCDLTPIANGGATHLVMKHHNNKLVSLKIDVDSARNYTAVATFNGDLPEDLRNRLANNYLWRGLISERDGNTVITYTGQSSRVIEKLLTKDKWETREAYETRYSLNISEKKIVSDEALKTLVEIESIELMARNAQVAKLVIKHAPITESTYGVSDIEVRSDYSSRRSSWSDTFTDSIVEDANTTVFYIKYPQNYLFLQNPRVSSINGQSVHLEITNKLNGRYSIDKVRFVVDEETEEKSFEITPIQTYWSDMWVDLSCKNSNDPFSAKYYHSFTSQNNSWLSNPTFPDNLSDCSIELQIHDGDSSGGSNKFFMDDLNVIGLP